MVCYRAPTGQRRGDRGRAREVVAAKEVVVAEAPVVAKEVVAVKEVEAGTKVATLATRVVTAAFTVRCTAMRNASCYSSLGTGLRPW